MEAPDGSFEGQASNEAPESTGASLAASSECAAVVERLGRITKFNPAAVTQLFVYYGAELIFQKSYDPGGRGFNCPPGMAEVVQSVQMFMYDFEEVVKDAPPKPAGFKLGSLNFVGTVRGEYTFVALIPANYSYGQMAANWLEDIALACGC